MRIFVLDLGLYLCRVLFLCLHLRCSVTLEYLGLKFFTLLFIVLFSSFFEGVAQDDPEYEKQFWEGAYFNWKLDDNWSYNQDFGYQYSYETPTFTRISFRSQFNREPVGHSACMED